MDPFYARFFESFSDSDDDTEPDPEPDPINCEVAKHVLIEWSTVLEGRPSATLWQPFADWVDGAAKHKQLRISVPVPPPPMPVDYPTKDRQYNAKCQEAKANDRFCRRHIYTDWGRSYVSTPDPTHRFCQIHAKELM